MAVSSKRDLFKYSCWFVGRFRLGVHRQGHSFSSQKNKNAFTALVECVSRRGPFSAERWWLTKFLNFVYFPLQSVVFRVPVVLPATSWRCRCIACDAGRACYCCGPSVSAKTRPGLNVSALVTLFLPLVWWLLDINKPTPFRWDGAGNLGCKMKLLT